MAACWCRYATRVETPHRVVVLQHPREARRALGSARVLQRILANVVVRVGIDFTADPEVVLTRTDPTSLQILLFPKGGAAPLDPANETSRLTIFVLDGTWSQARSLLAANAWLGALPYLRLSPTGGSAYVLRRQPFPEGLCTLEAVGEALTAIVGDDSIRTQMVRPLRALVGMHLASRAVGASGVLADTDMLKQAGYLPPER